MTKKKLYTIIDIETTGGMARRDKITEIGIVTFNGSEIISTFSSLVNPERSIPPEITRITGITDEMVEDAPKFYEIAKEVVERTEGAIFVAHNVRFDYSFLKEEFARLGYTYTRRQLCTVRLARNTFPGLRSYSLGNLIKHFGINVNARHRALDDALATTELLGLVLESSHGEFSVKQVVNAGIRESRLPSGITIDLLHGLPESPGVYYFYNSYGKVIYIGKSINIKVRVMQHFAKNTSKAERLAKMVSSLSVEETGSELVAMLLESREIKKLQPEVNKAQRTREYPYFIYSYFDEDGYLNFRQEKSGKKKYEGKHILNHYGSLLSAKSHLASIVSEFGLCLSKCGLYEKSGPCYNYSLSKCEGACFNQERPESYNERANQAISMLDRFFACDFFIKLPGRNHDEIAIVLIEEGDYRGYGYIDKESMQYGVEELKEAINYESPNPEANRIVHTYLSRHIETELIYI